MKISSQKLLKITAFLSALIGFVILGVLLVKLSGFNFSLSGNLSPAEVELNSQIGDFVGGVTGSFWALSGIILFYLAIKLQSQELKDTREQFRDQQFDNSFFNLLRTQNEIRNNLQVQATNYFDDGRFNNVEATSIEAFDVMYNNLYWIYQSFCEEEIIENSPDDRGRLTSLYLINHSYDLIEISDDEWKNIISLDKRKKSLKSYEVLFDKKINSLGHYFRHLYNILKYVEDYAYSKNDKNKREEILEKYTNFIQAQLSNQELGLLFYNGLYFRNMYEKICRYELLENLAKEELIIEEHKHFYPFELKSKFNT